jgi:histidinol-phosphate aminotransferase
LTPNRVAERKAYNAQVRDDLFAFLRQKGLPYLPSDACFAMIEVGRSGGDVIKALAGRGVFVSGGGKTMPTWIRVSYGTTAQMDAFKSALAEVLA